MYFLFQSFGLTALLIAHKNAHVHILLFYFNLLLFTRYAVYCFNRMQFQNVLQSLETLQTRITENEVEMGKLRDSINQLILIIEKGPKPVNNQPTDESADVESGTSPTSQQNAEAINMEPIIIEEVVGTSTQRRGRVRRSQNRPNGAFRADGAYAVEILGLEKAQWTHNDIKQYLKLQEELINLQREQYRVIGQYTEALIHARRAMISSVTVFFVVLTYIIIAWY